MHKIIGQFLVGLPDYFYLCQRLKDGGSPSRRAAVIARTSRSGFFYARKSASNYSQKILAVAIP